MGQMRLEHWGHLGASIWNFEGSPNSPGAQGPEVSGETGAGRAMAWFPALVLFAFPSAFVLSPRLFTCKRILRLCLPEWGRAGDGLGPTSPPLPPRGPGPGRKVACGCGSVWLVQLCLRSASSPPPQGASAPPLFTPSLPQCLAYGKRGLSVCCYYHSGSW